MKSCESTAAAFFLHDHNSTSITSTCSYLPIELENLILELLCILETQVCRQPIAKHGVVYPRLEQGCQ